MVLRDSLSLGESFFIPKIPIPLVRIWYFSLANTLLMSNLVLFRSCTNLADPFYQPEALKTITSRDHDSIATTVHSYNLKSTGQILECSNTCPVYCPMCFLSAYQNNNWGLFKLRFLRCLAYLHKDLRIQFLLLFRHLKYCFLADILETALPQCFLRQLRRLYCNCL